MVLSPSSRIHPSTDRSNPSPTHSYGHQSQLLILGCPAQRFMARQENQEDNVTIELDDEDEKEKEDADKKRGAGGGAGVKRTKTEK